QDPAESVLRVAASPRTTANPPLLIGVDTGGTFTDIAAVIDGELRVHKLLSNAGFEDLIEIGRQNRIDIYALAPARPQPLVSRAMRFGVAERTLFDGKIALGLTPAELKRAGLMARRSRAQAYAVCLLHSYANPRGEQTLAKALAAHSRPVSVSHLILPEYREF